MEEQTQTSEAQTLYGQQTPRETGKQGVMALRMNEDGLLFFKPGDRLFLKDIAASFHSTAATNPLNSSDSPPSP
ncbi:hypothetical protein J2X84_004742 [Pseudomonas corrugata]|nr:hypothetical protein [Pseudomonas corrugata]